MPRLLAAFCCALLLVVAACSGGSASSSAFCKGARSNEPLTASDSTAQERLEAVRALASSAPDELRDVLSTIEDALGELVEADPKDPVAITRVIEQAGDAPQRVEAYLVDTCEMPVARVM